MKKALISLAVASALTLSVVGCSSSSKPSEPTTPKLDQQTAVQKRDSIPQLIQQGKIEEAKKAAEQVQQALPQDARAQFMVGVALYNKKEYDKAIEAYKKAIELDPKMVEAYNNLGNLYRDQQKFADAEEWYRKALGVNPKFAYAATNLALMLDDQNKTADGLKVLADTLKQDPTNTDLALLTGQFYEKLGQKDQAKATYEAILKLVPTHKDAKAALDRLNSSK